MKRVLIFSVAIIVAYCMLAETRSADVGYVFTSNLQSHSTKSLKSRVKSTIEPGRVAVMTGNDLDFPCIDVVEYITLGKGSFYKYYPPAQDIVEPEYVSAAAFKKATRKVNIYSQAPANWEMGRRYTFKPSSRNDYFKSVTVRVVRLSGNDVTLVNNVNEDFKPSSIIDISGKTVVEIDIDNEFAGKVYWFDEQQVVPADNLSGGYGELEIDENGLTYTKGENGERKPDSRLSYVFGEYPAIDYFGWISDTEIVIDDLLFVAEPQ